MIFNILAVIVGIFVLVFLEAFLTAFLNFKISIIIFLLLFKKIDWKIFLFLSTLIFLILDIVNNFPLGTGMIMAFFPLMASLLGSLLLSSDSGITLFLIRTVQFFLYYILLLIVPNLLMGGGLPAISTRNLLFSLIKAIISTVLLMVIGYLLEKFRGKKNISTIRFK